MKLTIFSNFLNFLLDLIRNFKNKNLIRSYKDLIYILPDLIGEIIAQNLAKVLSISKHGKDSNEKKQCT